MSNDRNNDRNNDRSNNRNFKEIRIRELSPGPHLAPQVGATDEEFLAWLGGPTMIQVRRDGASRTRGLSTLLHGNEPSGLRALQAWLRAGAHSAVNVVAFVGAVEAAVTMPRFSNRMLPGRRDLNRCFRAPFFGDEGELAQEALSLFREARCEAIIDIHNNSGHNPSYGFSVAADPIHLALTAPFATRFVLTHLRMGALMEMDSSIHAEGAGCPIVTIECGRAGDPAADAVAITGLSRYLAEETLELPGIEKMITVLADPVRVTVKKGLKLAFADGAVGGADLTLAKDVDRHNFQRLSPGAVIGWVKQGSTMPIEAHAEGDREVASSLFGISGNELRLTDSRIPIMMTTDPRIAVDDCLFYLCSERP